LKTNQDEKVSEYFGKEDLLDHNINGK